MNKKIKITNFANYDDLDLLQQTNFKTKQQIQTFYSRNKSKLPPILQSKDTLLKHFCVKTIEKIENNHQQISQRKIEAATIDCGDEKYQRKHWMETSPKICKIIFQKECPRKIRRQYLLPKSSHEQFKDMSIRTISNPTFQTKKSVPGRSQQSNKQFYLSRSHAKESVLQKIIQKIHLKRASQAKIESVLNKTISPKHNKQKLNLSGFCSGQIKIQEEVKKQSQIGLYINKITSVSPQDSFLHKYQKMEKYSKEDLENAIKRHKLERNRANKRAQITQQKFITHQNQFQDFGNLEPWNQINEEEIEQGNAQAIL